MSGTVSQLNALQNDQSSNVTGVGGGVQINVEMGEKSKKQDATGKNKKRIREPAPVKEALTNLSHCCIFVFTTIILYLSFKQIEFFTWHPILMSIGVSIIFLIPYI